MNVLLINPPVIRAEKRLPAAVVRSLFYNSPPLGLAYLAAVLEQDGHRVTILDAPVLGATAGDVAARAAVERPDLVGLTSTTAYFDTALAVAERLKAALPGVPICLGGPHFNANTDLLTARRCFDFGIRGEGEITLREVVRGMTDGRELADVPGVVTARNGDLFHAPERPLLADLDVLPLPARHLLPIHAYRPMPNDQYRLPKTSMITSRGCPCACTFCDKQTFGNRYRSHGPARIVEEVHRLEADYGIRDIAFVDSTFTPNRRRTEAVLDAMEADPPRASWTCSCRANVLTEDLLRRMRAMNCWRIRIGIESGNAEILRGIRKGITRDDVERTAQAADRLGFQVKAFFMIGHPGETRATIEDSIRFALDLPLKDVTVQINTPLRGTPQFEECGRRGTLLSADQSQYSFFRPVFIPAGLTAEDLVAAHRRFYRRFYLRPVVFWRHLKAIRGPSDVAKYLRAVPLVFSLLFSRRDVA